MPDAVRTALHQVNSGIEDVLSGYETLKARAEPEILPVATELDAMHRRHASELRSRLASLGEDTDDGSIRGTVNKAVTTLRDWVTGLDERALSSVRQGEEMLLGVYDAAIEAIPSGEGAAERGMLSTQADELRAKVATLPAS